VNKQGVDALVAVVDEDDMSKKSAMEIVLFVVKIFVPTGRFVGLSFYLSKTEI